jgi:hypothetical protein
MSFRTSIVAAVATLAACGGKVVVGTENPPADSGMSASAGAGGSIGAAGNGGAGASAAAGGTAGTSGNGTGASAGWDAGPTLDADSTRPPMDGGRGNRKRIAFSRGSTNGNLGGLIGADQFCQSGALNGVWKAWLSDSTTNAIDRIADVGPWITMTGLVAFANKAQLTQTPSAIIEYDQQGGIVAASSYWTGTRVGGTVAHAHCDNWRSSEPGVVGVWGDGRQMRGASSWTEGSAAQCLGAINLLCIEQ